MGRARGLVVFVDGALPGERARVRISAVKAKYAVGELLERLSTSPHRAEPFCPVFGTCGGCAVQHVAYPAQLAWKRRLVRDALERIGGLRGVEVATTIGMDQPRAYRNKVALVAERTGTRTRFGFYQARSHALVPVERCPVTVPQLDASIAGLERAAAAPVTGEAFAGVRHAVMRAGVASGESVLSLSTARAQPAIEARAAAIAAELPGVVGINNSFEPSNANAVLGRKMKTVWGRAEMEERIGEVRFRVSPASFFQINSEMVGRIFEFMRPALGPLRIVDLYCGAGTFSMFFAKGGAQVVGVEENPNAIREARANAALNGVAEQTRFVAGRVEEILRGPVGREALAAAEIVFLDPPRKGSDELTLAATIEARPPNVWYLSCNPATLARDLATLIAGGYQLGIVQPFDMFPQTGHVETLVTLYRERASERVPPVAPCLGSQEEPWLREGAP